MIRSLTAISLLMCVAGCSISNRTIEPSKLDAARTVRVHDEGQVVFERDLAAGSVESKSIAMWLKAHSSGWKLDPTTYAPAREIRGDKFTLDFHNAVCVLNYAQAADGPWLQVSQVLKKGDPIPDVFAVPGSASSASK
jgi:hypothetical protein